MSKRLEEHPILDISDRENISFTFDGKKLTAFKNEMISSALFANDIQVFGRHHFDGWPQGIFCANGQCGQCLLLVDGVPNKACITPLSEGMNIQSLDGLPELPEDDELTGMKEIEIEAVEVLIIGGGPAGLSAARELGSMGVSTLIADDKNKLGGKLFLQTHNFFGSIRDCFAGTRGMDIGEILSDEVDKFPSVRIWPDSPVVGVFSDRTVGVVREGKYRIVRPERIVIATGAREKMLVFHGCDLPGIYGAGAFQTLVNRDLVKTSESIFIIGGGNVGLIAAYQALQAGIEVKGIAEALPFCGGYKVHLDKLLRLGVKIFTSHTVLEARGSERVESIVISEIDNRFQPISGTEMEFKIDTLLVAVGLSPVDELAKKAEECGLKIYNAGDAEIIAEASAAMFSGRITGRRILKEMGMNVFVPSEWDKILGVLRDKPGEVHAAGPVKNERKVHPVIRCYQEIPCNPCTEVCPLGSMSIGSGEIIELPKFQDKCLGCAKCVSICPGLAITLVDRTYDNTGEYALVIIPWEMPDGIILQGMEVITSGHKGEIVGSARVIAIKQAEWQQRRRLVALEAPMEDAEKIAGIRIIKQVDGNRNVGKLISSGDDDVICRCERVGRGEIRRLIQEGVRDINDLKAYLRVGMGPCGGKTCIPILKQVFSKEKIDLQEVTDHVERPFTQEVPLNAFLGKKEGSE